MSKIYTVANLTPDLEQAWLQHLRDFDTAHPGCHFEVVTESETKTLADLAASLKVDPPFDFFGMMRRRKP